MKIVLQALLTLVVLNAVGRVGWASWNYYQLKDAAEQAVTLGVYQPTQTIHDKLVARATELELPIAPDSIVVKREAGRTKADARYTQVIEFFPTYTYPFTFSFSVEAMSLTGLK